MEPLITDKRHGIPLPSGTGLARAVAMLLRAQRAGAVAALARGMIAVPPFDAGTAEALIPFFLRYFRQGARRGAVPRAKAKKGCLKVRHPFRKNIIPPSVDFGAFDVRPETALEAVRSMVFHFLAGLNDSTADMLRSALLASLEKGESGKDLQRRLASVFGAQRAFTIGMTEASRSVHAGQLAAAKESGVVTGRTWLASADACPLCLELDGKTVGLDEPFAVLPGGGPYAVVMYPPAHPHCMCSVVDEL